MDTGQALTRFFKRDSTKANNLTLYPHKEEEFWLWVSSWALYISKPSDLGYDDTGYDLPPLDVRYHKLCMDAAPVVGKDGQEHFQREASVSLKDAAAVKRESIGAAWQRRRRSSTITLRSILSFGMTWKRSGTRSNTLCRKPWKSMARRNSTSRSAIPLLFQRENPAAGD